MSLVYLKKKRYLRRIQRVYFMLDINENNYLVKHIYRYLLFQSVNQFFELIDLLESDPKLFVPYFPDYKFWNVFRKFMNKVFKFKMIAKSAAFEFVMFFIVLFNTGTLQYSVFSNHFNSDIR
jgi:hypothetical protein